MKQNVTGKVMGAGVLLMALCCFLPTNKAEAATKKLNKKTAVMYTGQELKLKVKKAKSSSLKWSSSNKKVAVVKKGKVTALKKGKAVIKVKSGKKTLKCKVTVKSNYLNRKTVTVFRGGTFQMKAVKMKQGVIRGWKSDNPSVAAISASGVIRGVAKGTAVVTVKLKSETYRCQVQVVDALSREDFHAEFTDEKNNTYTNFIDYAKYWNYPTDYISADGTDKTKRGIGEGDTKAQVFAAYGETKVHSISYTDSVIASVFDGLELEGCESYCEYIYKEDGENYQLRFYFDEDDKVTMILLAVGL